MCSVLVILRFSEDKEEASEDKIFVQKIGSKINPDKQLLEDVIG